MYRVKSKRNRLYSYDITYIVQQKITIFGVTLFWTTLKEYDKHILGEISLEFQTYQKAIDYIKFLQDTLEK